MSAGQSSWLNRDGGRALKKIINRPEDVVSDMGAGIALAYPELEFDRTYHFVKKRKIAQDKVTLISGGGSGHEPAHAGYVGRGMLDVAVCGDVFASPSQVQVYEAIKAARSEKGTLLIIKNYSGDVMNFTNAAELAREDGIDVDFVKVDDDIAVQDSLYTVGRRGVAGTVLVHKVAGAAAEAGESLAGVKAAAEEAIANLKTIGFALSSCTVPAKGTPTFDIAEDEMEYGVGIHGEPGIRREKSATADELASRTVEALLGEFGPSGVDDVTVMVNGFGSTPLMELFVLNTAVRRALDGHGISVHRTFVGNYMTSIDMLGASITLMKMTDHLQSLLDAPADANAFKVTGAVPATSFCDVIPPEDTVLSPDHLSTASPETAVLEGERLSLGNIVHMVDRMGSCIIENEVAFCELDSHAGDGDFGMSVAKGFRQLRAEWDEIIQHHTMCIGDFLCGCSLVIMKYCGGASGPIWGSAFRSAGICAGDKTELSLSEFACLMQAAVIGIQKTGERSFGRGAVVGDKTLIDALVPCVDSLRDSADRGVDVRTALRVGALAAVEGAKSTELIVARMGRAGTVGERSIGYPDAGAFALGTIFSDIARSIE